MMTKTYEERYFIKLKGRKISLSKRMILIIIMITAVALRLFSAFYQGNQISTLPGVYDQVSYDGLAHRVVDGYGFSFAEGHWPATRAGEPTAHWSYLYTLYLATIYKLFGSQPLIARVIQALIGGVLQTFLVWRIGTRVFNNTVGLIAAAISAVYIYFFYYAGALITETFYIIGILWTFDVSFRIIHRDTKRGDWLLWLELGVAIGLTVLLRQVFLLFLPFLFLWIAWNMGDGKTVLGGWKNVLKQHVQRFPLKGLFVTTLVVVSLILPWTIRNYRAFDTFVLLNTNAGFAFFWGNHPVHGTHFIPILPAGEKRYLSLIPTELLHLNEAELDKALLKLGVQYVIQDPGRFLLLSMSRIEEYIKFWPSRDSNLISNISRTGSFGLTLPFMLYGIWIATVKTWQSRLLDERWDVVLLLLYILVYTAVHLFTWTLIRYRLPIDAVLVIFAALGIQTLVKKYFQRKLP